MLICHAQDWEQCRQNVSGIPLHFTDLNLFKYALNVIHMGNGFFTILFYGGYFLLAVMVEGDESSRLRMTN